MASLIVYTVPNNIAIVVSTLHSFSLFEVPPGVPFRLVDNFSAKRYYRYSEFVQPGNVYRCIGFDSINSNVTKSVRFTTTVFVEQEFILQCLKPNGVQLKNL